MTNIDPAITLSPSIVGQAEKAHAAILKRAISGTTLDEQQWITLNVVLASSAGIDSTELVARVASSAKFDPTDVEAAIAALTDAKLVEELPGSSGNVIVTETGRALVERLRGQIGPLVARAYGNIPPEDLATAARVLTEITVKLSEVWAAN